VKPDAAVLRSIIVTGLPYAAVVFSMTLYWRTDTVMIERLLPDGATAAGNYAQAFRLFDALAMIPVMFGGLLLPIMTRGLTSGDNIRPLAGMAGRLLLAPLGIMAVTLATFPREILYLLYSDPAESGTETFRLLMLTLVPVGATYIYSTILTSAGKFRLLGTITVTAMIFNLVLNRILIPGAGPTGAAITALSTKVATGCMAAVARTMPGFAGAGRIMSYILMLLLTFITGWMLHRTGLSWVASAALQLAAGAGLALLFRFAEPLKSLKLLTGRPDSA
jgi:O-antigen/teichoic acid export membrane protein